MADLPFVLAGPIVRRVDRSQVCVWIALSREPSALTLSIFLENAATPYPATDASQILRLGERLFVALLRVRGLDLAPSVGYEYRIVATYVDGAKKTATYDTDSAADEPSLRLRAARRPSFLLPGKVKGPPDLRIAQASCRKSHGGGADALAILSAVLDDTARVPDLRPQQLYLTGDQIYADDVAEELLAHIGALVPKLFGWREDLATAEERAQIVKDPALRDHCTPQVALERGLLERSGFLQAVGFKHKTAYPEEYEYYSHHLLSFQEWCVMYLLCWSPALWAGFAPTRREEINGATLDALELFRRSLPHVRKALANVATYMIFDDHDITDDWFQRQHRALIVAQASAGNKIPARIVRNGMLAYGLFQDWGNQPDDYHPDTGSGRPLLGAAYRKPPLVAGQPPLVFQAIAADVLHHPLGIRLDNNEASRKYWHYRYSEPDSDFTVIVLDSRTWRGTWVTMGGAAAGEALLTRAAVDLQLTPLDAGRTTILVAPAPIAGFFTVDLAQKAKMAEQHLGRPVLSEPADIALDYEGWAINDACLDYLIQSFAGHAITPIVLSGDVHYAYSQKVRRKKGSKSWGPKDPFELIQLCCSSAKNSESLTRFLSLSDLLTNSDVANAIFDIDTDDEVDALTLFRMTEELTQGLRADDMVRSAYDVTREFLRRATVVVGEFQSDPKGFARDYGAELTKRMEKRLKAAVGDEINAHLRPYVLTKVIVETLFGAGGVKALTGSEGAVSGPLWMRSLSDMRGPARYTVRDWDSLAGTTAVPRSTTDWYENYTPAKDLAVLKVLRDRSQFLNYMNFLSVGDTNIGLVDINARRDAGKTAVAHTLLWALPDRKYAMPLYSKGLAEPTDGLPAWGVTLHKISF